MGVRRHGFVLPGLLVLGGLLLIGAWTRDGASPAAEEQSLERARAELTLAHLQLARLDAILQFAVRYQIGADVATDIYDIALSEGIDPELAFRLIKVESGFAQQATSSAGAVGYTQILPSTARLYEPGLTTAQLYDRPTNLRLGFRYLRDLLDRYQDHHTGQLHLALLAYNRGPAKVQELLDAGRDPQNGYAAAVLRGNP